MKKRIKKDVYQVITNQIIDLLESGIIPWHKPWNVEAGTPCNLNSGKNYRGINTFLLSCLGGSKYWLTYKQAKDKGGQVMKGAKGVPVIFWNWIERDKKNAKTGEVTKERTPFLRYYTVFNLEQIKGIDKPVENITGKPEFKPNENAQAVIDNMPQRPVLKHGGNRAFYRPSEDIVRLPNKEDFEGSEEYYNTAFHEFIHSTGHESRLNRKAVGEIQPFGSEDYSKEELVAEMGAAYLSGHG